MLMPQKKKYHVKGKRRGTHRFDGVCQLWVSVQPLAAVKGGCLGCAQP